MGILSSLEQRSSSGIVGHPRDPVLAEWLGMGSRSSTGMSVTPDTAMKVTAVFRAVAIKAQTYASLPLGVYRQLDGGGREIDRKHPLFDVLCRMPNKWQTSFEWREMMSGHFELRGRCYSEIVSTGGKAVSELIPLHPDRVRAFRAPDGRLAFEFSPLDGPTRIILQHEMCFLHGLTTGSDGITPLSPIGECREAIGLSLATEEHGARLFGNGTRLGGILKKPNGHLKDDIARKKLLDSWNAAHRGVQNAGKTALLEDGLEWQALGMTNEDAQFIDSRTLQISEIARIFGVPPHKLYDLSRSTNNNIEHQGIEFVSDTVRPGAIRREEAMERDLLSGSSSKTHCIMFDLDGLMRGDSAARAAYYASALQNGYKNRDEVRIAEGDNPTGLRGMTDFTVQMNLTTIDKVGQDQPRTFNTNTP
jgi:HK97 family phage portal protein